MKLNMENDDRREKGEKRDDVVDDYKLFRNCCVIKSYAIAQNIKVEF